MKLILEEISQLNRRFDEQDGRLNRRFTDSINDRSTAIDSRLQSLEVAQVTSETHSRDASPIWKLLPRIRK